MNQQAQPTQEPVKELTPATLLVGNPNVGKSVFFGLLTGRYATVSNYPGTTVEISVGTHRPSGREIIDSPGANSLIPTSEDEGVTRDLVLERLGTDDLEVLQVCDAKNLRRALALTLELAELEVPMALVTNMLDEARSRGLDVDLRALSRALGIEVVGSVAIRRKGVAPVVNRTIAFRPSSARVRYDEPIEDAIAALIALLPAELTGKRGLAVMALAGDRGLWQRLDGWLDAEGLEKAQEIKFDLDRRLPESVRFSVVRTRLATSERLMQRVMLQGEQRRFDWLAKLGDLAMHPVWGMLVAAIALYSVYWFVGVLGAGEAVDFLETRVFEAYITPGADWILRAILPAAVEPFLVGAVGTELGTGPGLLVGDYGLISMALSYSVAIVLPIVGFFFIAFSIMEDSGYLPRLAVMLDRVFRLMGLNGKAVLPMILGLGCDTMATMTTRILPTKKERIIVTLLLALSVPCSAQLGVILGMTAALGMRATLVWGGTLVGVTLLVGYLSSKVLPGRGRDFILEIPPMRLPSPSNIVIKTLARVEWYLKEAVPLFILGTFVLWLLDRLSLLQVVRDLGAPVVQTALGLPPEATDAFLIGFLRRDYGAAGLYALFQDQLDAGSVPMETEIQVIVSLVTITLFVPCIANLFMIIKERGLQTGIWMSAFVFPFALVVGTALNFGLRWLWL